MGSSGRPGGDDHPVAAVDALTGLASRQCFAHHLSQADHDRDLAMVAVIRLDGLAALNRQLGFDTVDDLVVGVGEALGGHASVTTVVARLGGGRFGVATVDADSIDPDRWPIPLVVSARAAVDRWFARTTHDLIEPPRVRAGAAVGFGTEAWVDAEDVLDQTHPDVEAEPLRPRLDPASVEIVTTEIVPIGRSPHWRWLRLGTSWTDPYPAASPLASSEGRRLDALLVQRAVETVAASEHPCRVTVPIPHELSAARSLGERIYPILERHRVPPGRIGFEVPAVLVDPSASPATANARRLIDEMAAMGSPILVSGVDAGWRLWHRIGDLPVDQVCPASALVSGVVAGDPVAARELAAVVANGERAGVALVAPNVVAKDGRPLTVEAGRILGFTLLSIPCGLAELVEDLRVGDEDLVS